MTIPGLDGLERFRVELDQHVATVTIAAPPVNAQDRRFREEIVPAWAKSHKILIMLPPAKFGMGCLSYLGSVVLISFRDLAESPVFQYVCLIIGVMSMSTVLATVAIIYGPRTPSKQRIKRVAPH